MACLSRSCCLGASRRWESLQSAPMSNPYPTALPPEICLKVILSSACPSFCDHRSGLHLLSPYCKKFLSVNPRWMHPLTATVWFLTPISLGCFPAENLLVVPVARFRGPLLGGPVHLSASISIASSSLMLHKFRLGRLCFLPVLFDLATAQPSLKTQLRPLLWEFFQNQQVGESYHLALLYCVEVMIFCLGSL